MQVGDPARPAPRRRCLRPNRRVGRRPRYRLRPPRRRLLVRRLHPGRCRSAIRRHHLRRRRYRRKHTLPSRSHRRCRLGRRCRHRGPRKLAFARVRTRGPAHRRLPNCTTRPRERKRRRSNERACRRWHSRRRRHAIDPRTGVRAPEGGRRCTQGRVREDQRRRRRARRTTPASYGIGRRRTRTRSSAPAGSPPDSSTQLAAMKPGACPPTATAGELRGDGASPIRNSLARPVTGFAR